MNFYSQKPFVDMPLSSEQKLQIDEVIIRFSQKAISIAEMYSCIERIKGINDDVIYSYFPSTSVVQTHLTTPP
jgi:hypothetical protein